MGTDRPAWVATVLGMAGLIVTLAGSSLGAALFVVAWGLLALARADRCLYLLFRSPGLWVVPVFALSSVVWSGAPATSVRAGLELAMTVGIASLTAGFLKPRAFVSAMSVSLLSGAVLSLLFGRYGWDGMTGTRVFLGIFASKNTMGLFMSLLAIFAAATMLDRGQPSAMRLIAVLSFLLSLPLLLLAHSVGAVLTTAGALTVLLATWAFARLRSRERLLIVGATAAIVAPAVLVTVLLALNGTLGQESAAFIGQVLGKDATLTGRTVLWQIALTEIAKRPLFGVGYYGFWLQGNLLAESIWRSFGIESRMGFSFHDTFLEVAVELGWTGFAALAVTLILAIERSVRLALADRTWAAAAIVAIVFYLSARTFAEVDVPYPFSAGTFLLFVGAAYGADYAYAQRHPAVSSQAMWKPRPAGRTNV